MFAIGLHCTDRTPLRASESISMNLFRCYAAEFIGALWLVLGSSSRGQGIRTDRLT